MSNTSRPPVSDPLTEIRASGELWLSLIESFLDRSRRGVHYPVLPPTDPQTQLDALASVPPVDPSDDPRATLEHWLQRVLAESNQLHHPGFIGHQVSAPFPFAALLEATNAILNNGMANYEMGPIQSAMERRCLEWMASLLGLPQGAGGYLCSGGSLGNLGALLAARQAQVEGDIWSRGQHEGPPLTVLVSEQSHYCIGRAVRMMGWGDEGLTPVQLDQNYRIRPDALAHAHETAERRGRKVIALIGNACSTSTGSIDPLDKLADYAEQHRLWFHVDGAHGASIALSQKYRERLRGIERADSIVWDTHKMMRMPALNTAVIFRDERHARGAFRQNADYLFDGLQDPLWYDVGQRTIECTKRAMGLTLYISLQAVGTRYFDEYITGCIDRCLRFSKQIESHPHFELGHIPDANIICFRHLPSGAMDADADALDKHQLKLRAAILNAGHYYIVSTRLSGRVYLRCTIINPHTNDAHLDALLEELDALGRQLPSET